MKMLKIIAILSMALFSCNSTKYIGLPKRTGNAITGNEFYKSVLSVDRIHREERAKQEILDGNIPSFLRKFVKIRTSITTIGGEKINAFYFVLPDYRRAKKIEEGVDSGYKKRRSDHRKTLAQF